MTEQPINTLSWNVRGLNCPNRRAAVKATISDTTCHLVCLQETKLSTVDRYIAASLGGNKLQSFAHRPASGTRGGILMLWDDSLLHVSDITTSTFCLSAMVRIRTSDSSFKITSVYGPPIAPPKMHSLRSCLARGHLREWHGLPLETSTKSTVPGIKTNGMLTVAESIAFVPLCNLASSRRSIYRIEDSHGAMKETTQRFVNWTTFFAMRTGISNSPITFFMPSPPHFQTTAHFYSLMRMGPSDRSPSGSRTIGPRCRVSKRRSATLGTKIRVTKIPTRDFFTS